MSSEHASEWLSVKALRDNPSGSPQKKLEEVGKNLEKFEYPNPRVLLKRRVQIAEGDDTIGCAAC